MIKGTHKVKIAGKSYTLLFDANAMSDFETVTGIAALDELAAMEEGKVSITNMRALFWASLQEHHPETDLRAAGRLWSEAPDALNKVLNNAMPKAKSASDGAAGNAPAAMKND